MSTLLPVAAEFVLAQAPPPVVPFPPPAVPPEFREFGDMIIAALRWLLIVSGVGGFLYCGIQINLGRRNRNQLAQQGIFDTGYVVLGLAIGSMAAMLTGMFAF